MCEPALELGTVKTQTNPPVAFVVIVVPPLNVPDEQLTKVSELPENVTVTVFDSENPVPVNVTELPTVPWVGFTAITGVVTVNVPVAAGPPTSVAVTVVPDVPPGTTNVQVNAPALFVVREPLVQLAIVTESKTSDASVVDTEKPVPDTVTVEPRGPCVGDTVIAGVVTVNVPVAVPPAMSVAVMDVPDAGPITLTVPET